MKTNFFLFKKNDYSTKSVDRKFTIVEVGPRDGLQNEKVIGARRLLVTTTIVYLEYDSIARQGSAGR